MILQQTLQKRKSQGKNCINFQFSTLKYVYYKIKGKPALKQKLLVHQIWLLFQELNAVHAQSANLCCYHYKQYWEQLVQQHSNIKAPAEKKVAIKLSKQLNRTAQLTLNLRSLTPFATDLYKSKIMSLDLSPMAWMATWKKLKMLQYKCGYLDGTAMLRNICVENAKAPEDRPYQKRELNCTAYLYLSLAGHDWVVLWHMAT